MVKKEPSVRCEKPAAQARCDCASSSRVRFDSSLDFTPGVDKIAFRAASSGFGQGPLTPKRFIAVASPFATGPGAAVLYATGLGIIELGPDGSGGQAAIAIAQIAGAPMLTAGDFLFAPSALRWAIPRRKPSSSRGSRRSRASSSAITPPAPGTIS